MARVGLSIPLTSFTRQLSRASYLAFTTRLACSDCRSPPGRRWPCLRGISLKLGAVGQLAAFESMKHGAEGLPDAVKVSYKIY